MNPLLTELADAQVIPALVPDMLPRGPIHPMTLPAIPPPLIDPDTASGDCLVTTARLDRSGRFRALRLVRALGWVPGLRLRLRVENSAIVLRPELGGTGMVTSRGMLVLPDPVRRFTGIDAEATVVAIAVPADQAMIVAPARALASAVLIRLEAGHGR